MEAAALANDVHDFARILETPDLEITRHELKRAATQFQMCVAEASGCDDVAELADVLRRARARIGRLAECMALFQSFDDAGSEDARLMVARLQRMLAEIDALVSLASEEDDARD